MPMSDIASTPKLMVIAGPEGSGKSTAMRGFPFIGMYINADDIKTRRKCSDIEAENEAELIRGNLLNLRKDFTFETSLSDESSIMFLEIAKGIGYCIESVFVLTCDPMLNIKRIKSRVMQGGFDVLTDKGNARYKKSLQLLKRLVVLSDTCIVIDNTERPEVIYKKDTNEALYLPNDFWSEDKIEGLIGMLQR